jgi:hypothetical protein
VFTKFTDALPSSAKDRREAAIEKLLRVELRNSETNTRLYEQLNEDFPVGKRTMSWVLERARRLINKTIGAAVPTHLLMGEFSGGASTSKRRGSAMIARKFTGQQDVTQSAWDSVWPHIVEDKLWPILEPSALQPRFVEGSVLFTVPKSDVIDRVACKEPDLNMWIQKGVGNFIRHRLRKRAGINLNDQTVNQLLAKRAWGSGLATVDLSSASDTVCTQLVARLLPTEWFVFLNSIRSTQIDILSVGEPDKGSMRAKKIEADGKWHQLEMFSSMGNGFTFELESLIFWALTVATYRAVTPKGEQTVSVYGDDIILNRRMFDRFRVVLSYCGFIVNTKKSHFSGPIRESCGKHYHCGRDVTPFYVRRPITTVIDMIHILNRIRKWSAEERTVVCDDFLWDIWRDYSRYIPKKFHGGWDCDCTYTLASPSGDRMRLVFAKVKRRGIPLGDYLSWLSDARTADVEDTGPFARTESRITHTEVTNNIVVRRPLLSYGTVCLPFQPEL